MTEEMIDNTPPNNFPDRLLTVSRGQRYLQCIRNYEPFVRITGKWLLNAGFHPGDKLRVTVENLKSGRRYKNEPLDCVRRQLKNDFKPLKQRI